MFKFIKFIIIKLMEESISGIILGNKKQIEDNEDDILLTKIKGIKKGK